MLNRVDIKAVLEDIGVRYAPIFSGIRPTIRIQDEYLTTSVVSFAESTMQNRLVEATVSFISPKYYANSLWQGKKLEVYEGEKIIGYLTVTEILNPVLDRNAEKWIVFDGREIHNNEDFYKQVQKKMTKNLDFQIGNNLNAFNDLLWGGFGVHDYGEPLHIVWIFAEESKENLGEEFFAWIVDVIEKHESGNKYLEIYKEHAF